LDSGYFGISGVEFRNRASPGFAALLD